MKRFIPIFISLCILSACNIRLIENNAAPEINVFRLSPSKDGVEDFIKLIEETKYSEAAAECYNVTPKEITDKYNIRIFKFNDSCESMIMHENEIYNIGMGFGGLGITSLAVTDMNRDGEIEIYCTYSYGSGIHRSCIGYFDMKSMEEHDFGYSYYGMITQDFEADELIFTAENDSLSIYTASWTDGRGFVDMEFEAREKIGNIVYDDNEIKLELGGIYKSEYEKQLEMAEEYKN